MNTCEETTGSDAPDQRLDEGRKRACRQTTGRENGAVGMTDVLTRDRTGGRKPNKTQGRDNKNLQREDRRRKDCYTNYDTYDKESGFPPDCRVF